MWPLVQSVIWKRAEALKGGESTGLRNITCEELVQKTLHSRWCVCVHSKHWKYWKLFVYILVPETCMNQTLVWVEVLAESCTSSGLLLLTWLQAALFATQDLENMTTCPNRVGTYLPCSWDRVEVRCAALYAGKPNIESGIGKQWSHGERGRVTETRRESEWEIEEEEVRNWASAFLIPRGHEIWRFL